MQREYILYWKPGHNPFWKKGPTDQKTAMRKQPRMRFKAMRKEHRKELLHPGDANRRDDAELGGAPAFVVSTAWVTLLYVVGLAECRAATSIGRTEEESLALGRAVDD